MPYFELGIIKDRLKVSGDQKSPTFSKTRSRHRDSTGSLRPRRERSLGCQTLAAFGATAIDHLAAFGGGHAGTETVGATAL